MTMAKDEETIITASHVVCHIDRDELAARFEAIMNPTGTAKGDSLAVLRFMCRMLADDALDYFMRTVQTGEKTQ
jgi:hypothetical protein